jgi:hypothetical protein
MKTHSSGNGHMIDDLQSRMEELRRDLGRNVEETVQNARVMLDWRHYVATHPWLCMTAAAAVGFLLVPRRTHYTQLGRDAVDELTARGMVVVRPEAAATPPGSLAAVLGGTAAKIAARMLVTRDVDYAENRLRERSG